ncbi:MAG TPA: flavin reductase family protein [Mycobacterium sp.]|jgi:hypothetical protein|nr:flavin reductase family protein [Mycobacterium sp.]
MKTSFTHQDSRSASMRAGSGRNGAPVLDSALAVTATRERYLRAFCSRRRQPMPAKLGEADVEIEHDAGDHTTVARVTNFFVHEGRQPLLFYRGSYGCLA